MKQIVYDVKMRAETIVANTRLNDKRYSGWKAINIGTADVTVDGVTLQPGEGIDHQLQPFETWTEPIDITVQTGGAVRLLRKLCTPHVVDIPEDEA